MNLQHGLQAIIEHENNQMQLINDNFQRIIEQLQSERDKLKADLREKTTKMKNR